MKITIIGIEEICYIANDYYPNETYVSSEEINNPDTYFGVLSDNKITVETVLDTFEFENDDLMLAKFVNIKNNNHYFDNYKIIKTNY